MPNKLFSDLNNFGKNIIPGYSKFEELFDNFVREKTEPVIGSIVYCNLGLTGQLMVEHTGIYIGNGQIVELQGNGQIAIVNRQEFLKGRSLDSFSIWVACYGNSSKAIGDESVAQRAQAQVGNTRNYHLLKDNCHRFTSGCITGNFDNRDTLFIKLRNTIRSKWGNHTWRVWR